MAVMMLMMTIGVWRILNARIRDAYSRKYDIAHMFCPPKMCCFLCDTKTVIEYIASWRILPCSYLFEIFTIFVRCQRHRRHDGDATSHRAIVACQDWLRQFGHCQVAICYRSISALIKLPLTFGQNWQVKYSLICFLSYLTLKMLPFFGMCYNFSKFNTFSFHCEIDLTMPTL